jgi:hypothetical protein
MAERVSSKFLLSTTIVASSASGNRPPILIPDNCHTIIVYNPSANILYVAIGSNGDVLDPTGASGTIPMIIPPSTSASIGMGALSIRPQSTPKEPDQFIYQTNTSTAQVNITYLCSIEY